MAICRLLISIVVLAAIVHTPLPAAETTGRVPTVEDLLKLESITGAQISPDGNWLAYVVNETDFKQDAFVSHLWLANTATGRTFQVTRGEKGAGSPQWSPDMEHNLAWFNHYIFGDPLPDFANPSLPKKGS